MKLKLINKSLWLALMSQIALMIVVASITSILLSMATALIVNAINSRTGGLIGEISFARRFIGWLVLIFLAVIIDKLVINQRRG